MEVFLQILGGVVVSIVLIVILIYFYFQIKFGKYLHVDPNANQTPLHIHLNEDFSPDWLNRPDVKKVSGELKELEFTAGKSYFIYEMDGYLLQVFFKSPVVAVMYWHDVAGCWVDMVFDQIDGIEYTFSNAPMGGGMAERPECIKVFNVKARVSDLYNEINEIITTSDHDFVEVNEDNIRCYFEAAFKKDIAWKNRNGGISYEEFIVTEKEAPFRSKKKTYRRSIYRY